MKRLFFLLLVCLLSESNVRAQLTVTDSIVSNGVKRYFDIYIPASYKKSAIDPLIFNLHGYAANAIEEQLYTANFTAIADTAGFFLVYPQGLSDGQGNPYWNIGFPWLPNSNDVLFISDLIDTMHSRYGIDLSRVYSTGLSLGGFMSYQLAWLLGNRITAIASVSGSMYPDVLAQCTPERAVPIMEIHGTADMVIPYLGATGTSGSVNIDTLVSFWAKNDQCIPIPIVTHLPNTNTSDGSTVDHIVYSGGRDNASVELYKVIGGSHIDWPGATTGDNGDFNASLEIWRFFSSYRLDQFASVKASSKIEAATLSFYPNPCDDRLTISDPEVSRITIFDQLGRQRIRTTAHELDLSRLPLGVYFVRLNAGNSARVEKLVKR